MNNKQELIFTAFDLYLTKKKKCILYDIPIYLYFNNTKYIPHNPTNTSTLPT